VPDRPAESAFEVLSEACGRSQVLSKSYRDRS
jgi:hypothetical protein